MVSGACGELGEPSNHDTRCRPSTALRVTPLLRYTEFVPIAKTIMNRVLATKHGEAAYKIVERLSDAGFDAWWVGGTVREMMQGIVPDDIDIATSATPKKIATVFTDVDDSAAAFGSMRVTMKGEIFEVTTFREDDEASDGRHPESVTFGTREEDARRRDFTVNAMYWHPISRDVFDPFEGEADLKEKLVRFIGDPGIRIKHDVLRMLRAVRFRAKLDGQFDPETYRALQELAPQIETLSGSRMMEEVEKMLLGANPQRAFEDLWETRLLQYMLPELYACKGVAQPADYHHEGDVWEHTMQCLKSFRAEDSLDVRIATLFHDCGKAETFKREERIRFDHHAEASAKLASKALDRLQVPKKRREKIAWIIEHHMTMSTYLELSETRKAHWYFHPWFADLLAVFWLDIAGTTPSDFSLYDKILKDYHAFLDAHPAPAKPLLTGDEVMKTLGIKPGEEVGKALAALHAAQTEGKVNTKKEAMDFLKNN